MTTSFKLDENLEFYFDNGYKRTRLLWELISNSDRVINSVYIFKHFDEYSRQLSSDKQDDKKEIYWNGAYYEKLIDYIKIVVAFETLNKALLIKNGILVHKIDSSFNKQIHKKQKDGLPIKITDFYENNHTNLDFKKKTAVLNGLSSNLSTINFSQTLNSNYQLILNQDKDLVTYLKEININRNRLHLYLDFKGAYSVSSHLKKWKFIKETATSTIRTELKIISDELKNCA